MAAPIAVYGDNATITRAEAMRELADRWLIEV